MSSKSIHAFEQHRRNLGTTAPPPPATSPTAQLEQELRRQLGKASRAMARAQELEAMIALLRTNDPVDVEFDARLAEMNQEQS
jgi:transposase-like protein